MNEPDIELFSARVSRIQVTSPSVELRHYISDDELDALCASRGGASKDICLVSIGAFLGAFLPAVDQASRLNAPQNPMGISGLLTCVVAAATLAAAVIAGGLWREQARQQAGIVSRIRGRPKYDVPK